MGRSRSKKDREYTLTIYGPGGEEAVHLKVTHLKCDDGSISFYENGLKCKTNLPYLAMENEKVEEEKDEKDEKDD